MKLGDKIWHYDATKYVPRDTKVDAYTRWTELEILGDTRISWIVGPHGAAVDSNWGVVKIKKQELAAGVLRLWATSTDQIERKFWVSENGGYKLSDRVQRCNDYDILVAIDKLLNGYEANKRGGA